MRDKNPAAWGRDGKGRHVKHAAFHHGDAMKLKGLTESDRKAASRKARYRIQWSDGRVLSGEQPHWSGTRGDPAEEALAAHIGYCEECRRWKRKRCPTAILMAQRVGG